MSHQLIALLCRRIKGHGVVNLVISRIRHLLVGTIDGRRGCIDEMVHRVVTAGLEDIVEANEVGLDIGIGVGDAVADTGLCGEIHHDLRLVLREYPVNESLVRNISLYEYKIRILLQFLQTLFLQTDIIIIIHIVDTHYLRGIEILVYRLYKIAADESGSSGNQYCHIPYHLKMRFASS